RTFYRFPGLVGDGRDLGSVVFPGAGLKVFLTASPRVRAERRYKQLLEAGQSVDMAAILKDLEERDERDSRRAVAPLRQEEDALLLDTSDLGVEAAVRQVLDWYGSSLYMLK
ncbi:MAG: (d)CMP kinase, partial [Azovibrio sp.]